MAGLKLVLALVLLLETVGSCQAMPNIKRVSGMRLQDCIDDHGVKRSDDLNFYLSGLAKCVASVGRPRFGKRGDNELDVNLIKAAVDARLRQELQQGQLENFLYLRQLQRD